MPPRLRKEHLIMKKPYEPPYLGKQTVQPYHPERGINNEMCVSTYGPNGWIQTNCSKANIKKLASEDLEYLKSKYPEEFSKC